MKNDIGGVQLLYLSPPLALGVYLGMVIYIIYSENIMLLARNAAACIGITLIHSVGDLTTHRFSKLIRIWKEGGKFGFLGIRETMLEDGCLWEPRKKDDRERGEQETRRKPRSK